MSGSARNVRESRAFLTGLLQFRPLCPHRVEGGCGRPDLPRWACFDLADVRANAIGAHLREGTAVASETSYEFIQNEVQESQ
ncbi:MAG: hypothetical protein JWM93_1611 [Frankiales bacterium]|nr:hypothetical protein [Frankiales bacterium]